MRNCESCCLPPSMHLSLCLPICTLFIRMMFCSLDAVYFTSLRDLNMCKVRSRTNLKKVVQNRLLCQKTLTTTTNNYSTYASGIP